MSRWVSKPIGEIATLQRGHDLPTSKRVVGDVPVMGSAGITGFHNEAKISDEGVFIGRSGVGSMGVVSYIDRDHWPLNTSLYVKEFHGNHPKFIYYLFKTINFRALDSGTAQASLNRNAVHLLEVKIPESYETQKEIADILTSIENKIELNRQTNQTLEQIAQAMFKSWFVDFEPTRAKIAAKLNGQDPERAAMAAVSGKSIGELDQLSPDTQQQLRTTAALFPDELVDSELGEIPEGWEVKNLDKKVIPKKGKNITRNTITIGEVPVVAGGLTPAYFHNTYNVSGPVITVSASGANAGFVNLYHQDIWASDCSFVNNNETKYLYSVYLFFKSRQIEITKMQQGAAQPHVYPKDLARMKIVDPPKEIWKTLENIIRPLFEVIGKNNNESLNLSAIRDSLLPKLLSGELEVSTDA
jgi:type I restriction enzyme S subunit